MESEETDRSSEKDEVKKESESEESMSSWFTGWYDSAKQKIAETNEFMKHDLQEFSQAFQTDASRLVAATATTMKEKLNINVDLEEASAATRVVKDSLSNFLGNIANKVGPIHPVDDENADDTAIIGTSSGTKVLSPSEARIYTIRTDPATFCNEPDNEKDFHSWLPSFNLEDNKTEISSLMLDCSQIRSLYTKLVPTAVSHCDFWARYFFKLHQHEKAEERRAMLVERAHNTQYDDIEWEDDEDDDWVQPKSIPKHLTEAPVSAQTESEYNLETPQENVSFPNNKEKAIETESSTVETGKNAQQTGIVQQSSTIHELEDDQITDAEIAEPVMENSKSGSTKNSELETLKELGKTDIVIPEEKDSVKLKTTACQDETRNRPSEKKPTANSGTVGKVPSSEESSDDWEKDFDLDMTEDEIKQALEESATVDVGDIDEDWDEWE